MSNNPVNLGVRFLLELAALASIAAWGWRQADGLGGILLAVGLVLMAAATWGAFRVPDDASASGRAPIPVPGLVRILLELVFFGFAVWGLLDLGATSLGLLLASITLLHYLASYDRILWLLRQ